MDKWIDEWIDKWIDKVTTQESQTCIPSTKKQIKHDINLLFIQLAQN